MEPLVCWRTENRKQNETVVSMGASDGHGRWTHKNDLLTDAMIVIRGFRNLHYYTMGARRNEATFCSFPNPVSSSLPETPGLDPWILALATKASLYCIFLKSISFTQVIQSIMSPR